jgi:hypothetical protein
MKCIKSIGIAITLLFVASMVNAQNISKDTATMGVQQYLPKGYCEKLTQKLDGAATQLNKQTLKAIRQFKRQEAKLQKLLAKKDSAGTAALFNGSTAYLQNMEQQFTETSDKAMDKLQGAYNAYLDSLATTFQFLQQPAMLLPKATLQKLQGASNQLGLLTNKLAKANAIKQYLQERRQMLQQQLQNLGLGRKLKQLNKSVYYYGQYIRDCKEMVESPKRIEKKALEILSQSPIYKKFVAQNTQLASLFRLPGASSSTNGMAMPNLPGLQTRASVGQAVADRIGSGGSNAIQALQQQVQNGLQQLNTLKQQITQYGSADGDMPGFTPNTEKTKPLHKRITVDILLQFGKSPNAYMPTAANLALNAGFKFRQGLIAGIGVNYHAGFSGGIKSLSIRHLGLGFRAYVDTKLKGQLYITGAYEQNHLDFGSIAQLRQQSGWQPSGLVGITKKTKLRGNKFVKASLLWDFLSYQNRPATQPLVFRFGYSFR